MDQDKLSDFLLGVIIGSMLMFAAAALEISGSNCTLEEQRQDLEQELDWQKYQKSNICLEFIREGLETPAACEKI